MKTDPCLSIFVKVNRKRLKTKPAKFDSLDASNPEPQNLNLETNRYPTSQSLNPQASTREIPEPKPGKPLNSEPYSSNPKPWTLDPEPWTLNPEP